MKDKVVVVTGGGTGIGKAISLLLAKQGALVAIVYSKSKDDAEKTVEEIRDSGTRAISVMADVSDEKTG